MTDSLDIAEELPQLGHRDPYAKARQILAGMSHYRIDRSMILVKDTPRVKSDRGIVVAAKFILPETRMAPTLLPGAWTVPFLEVELAVKMLQWSRDDGEDSTKFFKSLVNELSIMATLSHPNIIHLIGFVEDIEKGSAWIIVPWEANGNVREFLQSGEYDIPERVSLIQDVASGLEYLHTRQPPICHGDLKSLNILVNSSYQAVITDFGSARIRRRIETAMAENQLAVSPHHFPVNVKDVNEAARSKPSKIGLDTTLDLTLTEAGFSIKWAAPELLSDKMQDLPSDMWSIGWICWEIITGKYPFEGIDNEIVIVMDIMQGQLPAIREDPQMLLN
ncbi:hypothetical protein FRC00_008800 [Tulasnella sp. 408]|nr:hypothetical protein FRC00_008800 [Tulasnella sp. 408]